MKRLILLSLVAVSLLSAAPAKKHHPAKKNAHRVPGVLNAATYPVRKGAKPVAKAALRMLW